MALRDLLADEGPDFLAAVVADLAGDDGRAAGRQLVENAQVQVAVERKRERARDGRRGHDEDVGLGAVFFHQAEALEDAEAVLLIDDDEAEIGELDFLLDESVRADDEVRLALSDAAARGALQIIVERAREERDAVLLRRAAEDFARGEIVLRGENFSGRHERGLVAVLDGDQHGLERNDGFAGADVALEQAAHGRGAAHVRGDFAESALLRGGGMEREHGAQRGADLGAGLERDAGSLLEFAALDLEAEFQVEEFLEDEASMGGRCEGLELGK